MYSTPRVQRRLNFNTPRSSGLRRRPGRRLWRTSGSGGIRKKINQVTVGARVKTTRVAKTTLSYNNDGGDKFFSYTFRIDGLPNVSEFTSVFDQYKITAVKLHFVPRWTTSELYTTGVTLQMPNLVTAFDGSDAVIPTSVDNVLEYDSCRIHGPLNKMITRVIYPSAATPVFRSGASSAYGRYGGWVDCAYPDVQFFGFRAALLGVPTVNTFHVDVYATYYLEFRNTK